LDHRELRRLIFYSICAEDRVSRTVFTLRVWFDEVFEVFAAPAAADARNLDFGDGRRAEVSRIESLLVGAALRALGCV